MCISVGKLTSQILRTYSEPRSRDMAEARANLAAPTVATAGGRDGGWWTPPAAAPAWVVAQLDPAGRRAVSLVSFGACGMAGNGPCS